MIDLLLTLLSPDHPICSLMLGLIHFVQSRSLSLMRCKSLFPYQFIERIYQDMDICFQSFLALANEAVILPNIDNLRYDLASPSSLIAPEIARTKPSNRAPSGNMGGSGGVPSISGGSNTPLMGGIYRAEHYMYPDQNILLQTIFGLRRCCAIYLQANPGAPNGGLPNANNVQLLCLIFNLAGNFSTNCRNRASHQPLSTAEHAARTHLRTVWCLPHTGGSGGRLPSPLPPLAHSTPAPSVQSHPHPPTVATEGLADPAMAAAAAFHNYDQIGRA